MRASNLWWILLVTAFVLAVGIMMIVMFPPQSRTPSDTATVLAVVGLVAVGIERALEGIWSIVDLSAGEFWPLNLVVRQVKDLVNGLNQPLTPVFEQMSKQVAALDAAAGTQNAKTLEKDYGTLRADIAQLQKVATATNPLSKPVLTTVKQRLSSLQEKYHVQIDESSLTNALDAMEHGADNLDEFVRSFGDNPARRFISLYLGLLSGLVIAWISGLDLLATVLKAGQNHPVALGIIGAGIVMGLGSNPAHEIIKAIMNWRQSLQS